MCQFKQKCIDRWTGNFKLNFQNDKKLKKFEDEFEKWIIQIPTEYHDIVYVLIENFDYYTRKSVNQCLEKLHGELISKHQITQDNTVYSYIKSEDGESNSSNDYWTEYKNINELNGHTCFENLNAIKDEWWVSIKNIVFIDDFSGSGESLIKELKKHVSKFGCKNIFLISINIMELALLNIDEYCKNNNMEFYSIPAKKTKKALENDLFIDSEITKQNILEMSETLGMGNCSKKDFLGYSDSQALVAFYNNTPNNTIKFIWCDNKNYFSIFPRHKDEYPSYRNRPSPSNMKEKSKNRTSSNYNSISKGR